jgi:hypothetical protein
MRSAVLSCLLLLLAACHGGPARYLPEESAKYSLENTEKFRLLDRAAQRAIACTGLQEHVDNADRLEVVANLRNRNTTAVALQVRCVFADAAGTAIGDETPWLPLNLAAGDTEAVHYFATSQRSRRFTIEVRSTP